MELNEETLIKKFMAFFVFASLIINIAGFYISTSLNTNDAQIIDYSQQIQSNANALGNLTTYIHYLSATGPFAIFATILNYVAGFLNGIGYIVQFIYHIILMLVIAVEIMVYIMFSFMPSILAQLGIGFLGYIFGLIDLIAILVMAFVVLRYIRSFITGFSTAAVERGVK